MKITLTTRTSQQLSLTPQLQQAIRLLTLSNLELRQELDDFIRDNPLLELEDHPEAGAVDGPSEATEEPAEQTAAGEEELDSLADWKTSDHSGDDDEREDRDACPVQLADHLRDQVAGLHLQPRDRLWLEILIQALDPDGFLRDEPHELAASFDNLFIAQFEEPLDADEVAIGLKLLQSLDPIGVGAQSLQECLCLQLADLQPRFDGPEAVLALAQRLLKEEFEALGTTNPVVLAKTLQVDRELLQEALRLIRRLNPRPASSFRDQQAGYLTPDVLVYKTPSGQWRARLARGSLPRLSINQDYAQAIKQAGAEGGLQQKLQEARWMLKNIQQRSETILRVSQAIVSAQRAFFDEGPKGMRPLVLRDIADRCELHESTVSRVTNQKFMLTPQGCFELKYFFGSHVATDDGGTASATALRAQIQDWIKAESPDKPLSDQAIADRFSEQGVVVARRTVAKYRESLRIPSASQRKQR